EINFSRKLFWTTFLQYNTQEDNFNINSRIQWRFQPMSDLYIVYTDNYAVEFWGPKHRALVIKLNYWFNF
ncbi:MAG: hydrolase, partial [Bacteroidetes bacterium]